jgi:hypothetical protein
VPVIVVFILLHGYNVFRHESNRRDEHNGQRDRVDAKQKPEMSDDEVV